MVDRTDADPYNLALLNSDQLLAPSTKASMTDDNADMMTAPDSDYEDDVVMQRKEDELEEVKEPLDDTRFEQLTQQALQQPSTIVNAAPHSRHAEPNSADSDKVVPVVQVQVVTNADATVNVKLDVITRYVPHLHTNATAKLLQSVLQRNNMQAVDDDDTSIDSEDDADNNAADLTGDDFEMTGNLETDRKRLLQLVGGTMSESDSDDSDSSSDDDDSEKSSLEHHLAEEEEESYSSNAYIRSKNEVEPNAVDVEPITIPVEAEIQLAGQLITPNVDGYSVVQGIRGQRPLGLNSVLCHADRIPLGRIEEVIGNVSEPFYTVRAPKQQQSSSNQSAADDDDDDDEAFLARLNGTNLNNSATPSTPIYYVPSLSQFAQADQTPGSDASNLYDEEVADHEREYSDDEDEAAAKAARKSSKKRGTNGKPAVTTDALPQQQQQQQPHHPRPHNTSPRQHHAHQQHMPQPTTYAPNYQLNAYQPMNPQPQPHHYPPQQAYQQPHYQHQHPPPQYPPAMHQQAPMQYQQQPHQPAPSGYQPVAAHPSYQQPGVQTSYPQQQPAQNPYYAPQPCNPYYAQSQPQNPYHVQPSNNPYYQQQQQQQHPMPPPNANNAQQPPGL